MVIPNLKFSEMGGRYSGVNFGHPKSEVFQNGGGYSRVNFGHPKSEVSEMGGGGFLVFNSRKGLSGKFGPKFTVQPETSLCITVVSHILRMWRLKSEMSLTISNLPSIKLAQTPHWRIQGVPASWTKLFVNFIGVSGNFKK